MARPKTSDDVLLKQSVERFHRSYEPVPECGCWLWLNAPASTGYGMATFGRERIGAHCLSWILHNGPIPAGMQILHKCDVRACVNPSHLFLGTLQDNMEDMKAKKRQRFGESKPGAKLTECDVAEIKAVAGFVSQTELAKLYDVDQALISKIARGKRWKHVRGR